MKKNKKTIVIDAGHGGHDSGAVNRKYDLAGDPSSSAKEKNITLYYALQLGNALAPYFNVVHTRKDDTFVSLSDRAKIANDNGNAFLFSIHVNDAIDSLGRTNHQANGHEVFTSPGRTASDPIAEKLNKRFAKDIPDIRNRGVKEARFTVLTRTRGAAVLYELGFINNDSDFNKITSTSVVNRIVKGWAETLIQHFYGENIAVPSLSCGKQ